MGDLGMLILRSYYWRTLENDKKASNIIRKKLLPVMVVQLFFWLLPMRSFILSQPSITWSQSNFPFSSSDWLICLWSVLIFFCSNFAAKNFPFRCADHNYIHNYLVHGLNTNGLSFRLCAKRNIQRQLPWKRRQGQFHFKIREREGNIFRFGIWNFFKPFIIMQGCKRINVFHGNNDKSTIIRISFNFIFFWGNIFK